MSPTLVIDRIFPGVGRIARASGTDDPKTFRRINQAMDGLYAIGRLDVLDGMRRGVWRPLVVLFHWERGQIDRLPKAGTASGLVEAMTAFVATHECGASHRADMETSVRHLGKAKGGKTAKVSDLPHLLRTMKDSFRDRPVAFNRLRAHCLAFAGEIQGEMSPLWVEVKRVKRFKKAEGTRPRKLLRRPLTVAELDAVMLEYVDHPVYAGKRGGGRIVRRVICAGDLRHMTRFLATTGMRPQEYWQREGATWTAELTHVQVNGTKTAAAKRPTFLIGPYWPPYCGEQFFRKAFADATSKALGVALDAYSLRRTFATLCEDAGVVVSRRESYMGHGPKTVDELYLRTNVLPFVRQDAALVEAWIAAERARAAARPSLTISRGSVT